MSQRMLIDARHPEETRVAVIEGNRVEELDYESIAKRQLKGNIYLAKVTRVEPSLQACFVDYGGNRHGFLAFSEIHPDYYQIPVADREALIRAEAEQAAAEESRQGKRKSRSQAAADGDADSDANGEGEDTESEVEQVSGEEDFAEDRRRSQSAVRRRYNIQEVIKRRQILLVQVVKEERGSKGAALTTYLSLAGRYCVLMPNSTSGGGISRKIANQADRKKLKSVMSALEVPPGMGCIIRTAGLNRTRVEIKRDFDYLERLWDEIRELTLKSVAPALIHEEASLIRRSIRDLYTREIDEVLVEGEEGYKAAKEFMRLLMPSHAKKVKQYKDRLPLFHRYQVEQEIEAMYSPTVQLKSGGYVVINPTEALVAIDVNSGRSTREHNIEETAHKTNLEAASEIARQLRLRDLAGLIVIDFIDMEDRGNNRAVEKRMKESLKSDRARIQLGRLSSFGLLEMSRQRLRPNLLESSMVTCSHCKGAGTLRSTESAALAVLRALEEEGMQSRRAVIRVRVPTEVAFYLLNQKRGELNGIEAECGFTVSVEPKDDLEGKPFELTVLARGEDLPVEAGVGHQPPGTTTERALAGLDDEEVEDEAEAGSEAEADEKQAAGESRRRDGEEDGGRRRRRRGRRGRRGRGEDGEARRREPSADEAVAADTVPAGTASDEERAPGERVADGADRPKRRTRRRRRKPSTGETAPTPAESVAEAAPPAADVESVPETAAAPVVAAAENLPSTLDKPRRRVRRKTPVADAAQTPQAVPAEAQSAAVPDAPGKPDADAAVSKPAPARRTRRKAAPKAAEAVQEAAPDAPEAVPEAAQPPAAAVPVAHQEVEVVHASPETGITASSAKPAGDRKGWWKRALGR